MAQLEEKKVTKTYVTLTGLDRPVSSDKKVQKAIGLTAHYILERFEWDPADEAHEFVAQYLKDLKAAMGTRAPRKPDESAGPQVKGGKAKKKAAGKKAAKKKAAATVPPEGQADDKSSEDADSEQEGTEPTSTEDSGSPQADALAGAEESSSEGDTDGAEQGSADGGGSQLQDPFSATAGG
jgi:hypothetical protein